MIDTVRLRSLGYLGKEEFYAKWRSRPDYLAGRALAEKMLELGIIADPARLGREAPASVGPAEGSQVLSTIATSGRAWQGVANTSLHCLALAEPDRLPAAVLTDRHAVSFTLDVDAAPKVRDLKPDAALKTEFGYILHFPAKSWRSVVSLVSSIA